MIEIVKLYLPLGRPIPMWSAGANALAPCKFCTSRFVSWMPRDLELTSVEDANGVLLLQTDLSMNHSFSSVPLCDLDGPILVICSKKNEGGVQCIYFAITTNYGT